MDYCEEDGVGFVYMLGSHGFTQLNQIKFIPTYIRYTFIKIIFFWIKIHLTT